MAHDTLFSVKFSILTILLMVIYVSAQEPDRDPLFGNYRLGSAAELLLMHSDFEVNDGIHFKSYNYLNLNNPELQNQVQPGESYLESGVTGIAGDKRMDIITGDFDGDDKDDILAAWEGADRSIVLAFPEINRTTFEWINADAMPLSGARLIEDTRWNTERWLRLEAGHFDDDPAEEFVLAYWAEDSSITLSVFDTENSRMPVQRASISDVRLTQAGGDMTRRSRHFAVTTGDLDGDATDEIILLAGQPVENCSPNNGCWQVEMFFYDVDATNGQLLPLELPQEERLLRQKTNNSSEWIVRLAAATGDFDGDGVDEVALGFEETNNSSQSVWYLTVLKVNEDLNGITGRWLDRERVSSTTGSSGYSMVMTTADLTNDGAEELIYAGWQIRVYGWQNDSFEQIGTKTFASKPGENSHRVLVVADLDADNSVSVGDSLWRPEIITASWQEFDPDDGPRYTELRFDIYQLLPHETIPDNFTVQSVGEYQGERRENSQTTDIFLAAVDLGNNGVRLGTPQRYTKTDIVDPIVILNAPPTHFDFFDGQNFDITNCYDGTCDFSATYSTSTERTVETSTTFNSDWSVGAKTSGGFTIPVLDVGVKVKLEAKYGQGFSKRNRDRETFTVSQSIDAIADDWIYAVVVDYDIWEYPLYYENAIEGYVSVVIPKAKERAWFDSKSFSAYTYIPSHEVGNILSYQEITSPGDNAALDVAVRWESGDRITLNNNSNATWTLTQENQSEFSTQYREKKYLGGSVSFDIPFKFIPNVEINGNYSESSVSTYKSTVTDKKGLSVNFTGIDLSVGNTRYAVTPYAYWAVNGALVLDYAVKPELPPNPADPATWWSENYGQKPDPTFILPWKLDPEKGLGLSEEAQRFRTRDIIFDPVEPKPGDVVTLKARLQNYSFLPTPGPVKVRFYLGDSVNGGQLLESIVGQTEVFTQTGIAARGNQVVQFQWQVPESISRFSRIYAVIDPDNQVDEIHESNNKGWSVLAVTDGDPTGIAEDGKAELPASFELRQNFPNPFNPQTNIEYSIPREAHVTLSVFNIRGQEVVRLVDRQQPAGRYTATFQAGPLSSGLYFYKIEAGDFVQIRNMILAR